MTSPSDRGVAWITGASSGIGRAVARLLARQGWRVVASARRSEALESLVAEAAAEGGTVHAAPLDVTDRTAVASVVADIEGRIGPIELAILNAGIHLRMGASDFEAADFEEVVRVNLLGPAYGLEAVLKPMLSRGRGQVALIGSLAGYRGLPTAVAYGATKAALISMAEALKPELDGAGIKLQVVNPGFVKTPMTEGSPHPMPFLMEVHEAARTLVRGLESDRFEIAFPRPLVWFAKLFRVLPARALFAVTRRMVRSR